MRQLKCYCCVHNALIIISYLLLYPFQAFCYICGTLTVIHLFLMNTSCPCMNCLRQCFGLHLVVAAVVHVAGQSEAWSEEQLSFHHLGPDIFLQVGPAQTAVPVIRDVTSVHNLTKQVAQVIKRHLGFRGRGLLLLLLPLLLERWPVVFSRGRVWSDFQLRLQRVLFVMLLCGH